VQQLDQVRDAPTAPDQRRGDRPRGRLIYRHTALVRATHWINVVFLTILLVSGLQIFNAHPALYWGEVSNFGDPALSITAQRTEGSASRGITTVAGHKFDTTGWLGLSKDATGRSAARAFPAWATLPSWPSLAEGRLCTFSSRGFLCSTASSIRLVDRQAKRPSGETFSGQGKAERYATDPECRAVGAKASEELKATCGGKPIDAPSNLERRR
jgi:hypothetical protein